MPYLGTAAQGTFGTGTKDRFSGDNSNTSFTMSRSVGNANDIDVFVENVRQEPSINYTVSGTTLSFTGTLQLVLIISMWFTKLASVNVVPPSGRSTDNVADLQVTSSLSGENISGTLNRPIGLNATDGSETDVGDRIILNGTDNGSSNADDSLLYEEATDDVGLVTGTAVDTFTFDGNAKVEGTMRASATGAIKVEGNTDDGILILDASASGVDVGSAIVFEEGTDDGAVALSGVTRLSNLESVERGVTAKTEISDGGSSKILDFNANQNFIINMNASLTLGQPVTGQVGQTGFIVFKQDTLEVEHLHSTLLSKIQAELHQL